MGILYKVIITTSGLAVFAGTAYITAISLTPPPTYTVSNHQRLQRYDALAVNNVYEKKTKGQEFYLGLTRWRRTLLRDEHVLRGRVLQVGAGCGTNVPYYCQHCMTQDSTVQSLMRRLFHEMHLHHSGNSNNSNNNCQSDSKTQQQLSHTFTGERVNVNELLKHLSKYNACDEVILCDRAPNMVEACVRKVQSRLGYVPYRYPDYDIAHIIQAIHKDQNDREVSNNITFTSQMNHNNNNSSVKGVTVKRKVMRGDGTVSEVITMQDTNSRQKQFETSARDKQNINKSHLKSVAPIMTSKTLMEAERTRLLSRDGLNELRQRESIVTERQQLHHNVLQFLKAKREEDKLQRVVVQHQQKQKGKNEVKLKTNTNSNDSNHLDYKTEGNWSDRTTSKQIYKKQSGSWLHKLVPHKLYEVFDGIDAIMHRQQHYNTQHKNSLIDNNKDSINISQQGEVLLRAWQHETSHSQPLFAVANYAAEQLPFADNSFDTVVDMFGLCSYDDPVQALQQLSRVCKTDGKLLLIEHGKGHTRKINDHLDKWAPRHARNWGCWWNRDIRRLIRLSGVVPQKWQNKHFGTSHYIIAKPYKTMQEWDQFFKHPHQRS